jgi:hypothetical protein
MRLISGLRRFGEAIITAIGVVVGLVPDPTRTPVPVPVQVENDPFTRR